METGLLAMADVGQTLKDYVPLAAGVGAVIAAVIAGWFGGRNARKSPHERLKALVEIAKDMPDGLDTDETVKRAIERELRHIARLNAAREQSYGRYAVELLLQNMSEWALGLAQLQVFGTIFASAYWISGVVSGWVPLGLLLGVVVFTALAIYGDSRAAKQGTEDSPIP